MNIHTRRARLSALLVTCTSIAGIVVGASDSVSAYGIADTDTFKLESNGYDFGDTTFTNGSPSGRATVEWATSWWGNLPTVDGTLHLNRVTGTCARVKVVSYRADGTTISPTNFSPEKCATSNGHFSRTVSVNGDAGASKVKVVLESRVNSVGASWGTVRSKTIEYGPILKEVDVLIPREEFKFGNGVWDGSAPAGPGLLTVKVDGYEPYAELTGKLMIVNADDNCGRMRIKYVSSLYGVQDNAYGTERCVFDDDEHVFDIDLGNNSKANSYVDEFVVILERRPRGGVWTSAGSYRVTVP